MTDSQSEKRKEKKTAMDRLATRLRHAPEAPFILHWVFKEECIRVRQNLEQKISKRNRSETRQGTKLTFERE